MARRSYECVDHSSSFLFKICQSARISRKPTPQNDAILTESRSATSSGTPGLGVTIISSFPSAVVVFPFTSWGYMPACCDGSEAAVSTVTNHIHHQIIQLRNCDDWTEIAISTPHSKPSYFMHKSLGKVQTWPISRILKPEWLRHGRLTTRTVLPIDNNLTGQYRQKRKKVGVLRANTISKQQVNKF